MTALPDSAHAPTPFQHRVRVYWEDTDAGGVVYYANYLKFFERARTEWLRAIGVEQSTLRETRGAIFVVTDATLRFAAPARLDDWLQVSVVVDELRPASIRLTQRALRDSTLLCEGQVRVGCVDGVSLRPRRIPEEISSRL